MKACEPWPTSCQCRRDGRCVRTASVKRETKNVTKGSSHLLAGFGNGLVKHNIVALIMDLVHHFFGPKDLTKPTQYMSTS